ncbi:MAG: Fic family protein, partial [Nitrososphaera sp.]
DRLAGFHRTHGNIPPEVSAAWLHHRFTQIHPFQDGNGRVARALATIVFLRAGWSPLVINRDQRGEYIAALEAADQGDLKLLVKLFGHNAKRAFVRALSLSEDVLRSEVVTPLSRVVDSAVSIYEARRRSTEETYQQVEEVADYLTGETVDFLWDLSEQIKQKFAAVTASLHASATDSHENNAYYYTAQIVSVAKDLHYFANMTRHRSWARLFLVNGQKTHLVFSFHYLGKVNRGVMVCTGFAYFPDAKPEPRDTVVGEPEPEPLYGETRRICSEPFVFSYTDIDRLDELKADFLKWLEEAVSVGLAEWAQRL